MNEVKLIKMDETSATVGGYGVVFGGTDLEGDTFTTDTEFMLPLVPDKLVLYDHALGEVKHTIGSVSLDTIKADDTGLWIEAQLDRSREYVEAVLELVQKGVLGWSSGSVPHLVNRAHKTIETWPIVEFSLTPTPAEPRTLGVERIKALAAANPNLEALLPEVAKQQGDDASATVGDGEPQSNKETVKMSDVKETPAVAAPDRTDDILAAIGGVSETVKAVAARVDKLEAEPVEKPTIQAPVVLKHEPGVSFAKSFKAWLPRGDVGAFDPGVVADNQVTIKASNATDLNIGTDADGGYAVPTGHYNNIIAKRDDVAVTPRLGLRPIPGVGTTVDVPLDNEADGEFVSTAEAGTFDLDAPALGTKAMTLVKYSKEIRLSLELMQDEESNLMTFLEDFIGRGYGKTLDSLLLTEVAANGTTWDTYASATAIAVGEVENNVNNVALGAYVMDGSTSWVMNHNTLWQIKSLRSANFNNYADYPAGEGQGPTLLGYPVNTSMKAASIAASAVSTYFGNWNYVGWRQEPSLTFLRDPYSLAASGQVSLWYYFRTVFGVLQAEAIGFGDHPSA